MIECAAEQRTAASISTMERKTIAGMNRRGCINQVVIPSDTLAAKQPEREVLPVIRRLGYREQTTFAVKLALEEAIINAIRHGNLNSPNKYVTVRYDIGPHRIILLVVDEGEGFCPDKVPDPTTDENIVKPCGRGIMLMRAYMDEVRYSQRGNAVRMVKYSRSL